MNDYRSDQLVLAHLLYAITTARGRSASLPASFASSP
jgi:hypothetical protein